MTNQAKKDYNKEHYLKNRPVILERMKTQYRVKKTRPMKVVPIFEGQTSTSNQSQPKRKEPRPPFRALSSRINLGTLLLQILAAANTYFLITEMARVFANQDTSVTGSLGSAYLKACLLEGAVVSLCLMLRAKAFFTTALNGLLILLIYSYSIWVISDSAIQVALSGRTQVGVQTRKVSELELEMSKKTALRDSYFQADRVTLGSKLDIQIDKLREELRQSREMLVKLPTVGMVWSTLFTIISFRILIVFSNVVCLKELARRYRLRLKTA